MAGINSFCNFGIAKSFFPHTRTILAHHPGVISSGCLSSVHSALDFSLKLLPAPLFSPVPQLSQSHISSAASLKTVLYPWDQAHSKECYLPSRLQASKSFFTLREDGPNLCLWASCCSPSGSTLSFSPATLSLFLSLKSFSPRQGFRFTPHPLLNLGHFTSKWMTVEDFALCHEVFWLITNPTPSSSWALISQPPWHMIHCSEF